MRVSILGAFGQQENDEDRFNKWLRFLKASYGASVFGSIILLSLSAWYVGYKGGPFDHVLIRVLSPSIIMFLVLGSNITLFHTDRRTRVSAAETAKSYLSLPVVLNTTAIAFLVLAVEVSTSLNEWDLGGMLRWWRKALIIVSIGWLFLYTGEKTVHLLRSKSKKDGS